MPKLGFVGSWAQIRLVSCVVFARGRRETEKPPVKVRLAGKPDYSSGRTCPSNKGHILRKLITETKVVKIVQLVQVSTVRTV